MSWFVKGGQRRGLGVPQEGNTGFVMNPWGGGGVHVWLYPGSGGQASCSIKIR